MGIVKSGLKALTKGGAKKAPKAAVKKAAPKAAPKTVPKKPRPKYKDYKWDAGDYAMAAVAPVAVGAELIINVDQAKQLEKNRAKQQADLFAARGKPGSRAIGADKFGWAGRR